MFSSLILKGLIWVFVSLAQFRLVFGGDNLDLVVAYSEPNFSGVSSEWFCCTEYPLLPHAAVGSVHVPPGLLALFFEAADCTGAPVSMTSDLRKWTAAFVPQCLRVERRGASLHTNLRPLSKPFRDTPSQPPPPPSQHGASSPPPVDESEPASSSPAADPPLHEQLAGLEVELFAQPYFQGAAVRVPCCSTLAIDAAAFAVHSVRMPQYEGGSSNGGGDGSPLEALLFASPDCAFPAAGSGGSGGGSSEPERTWLALDSDAPDLSDPGWFFAGRARCVMVRVRPVHAARRAAAAAAAEQRRAQDRAAAAAAALAAFPVQLFAGEQWSGAGHGFACCGERELDAERQVASVSVRVQSGTKLELFADYGCSGSPVTLYMDHANLGDLGLSRRVRCIRISPAEEDAGVTVYTGAAFTGKSRLLVMGRYSEHNGGIGFNDEISSIRVPAGLMAQVWENADFSGRSQRFMTSVEALGPLGWDNTISAIQVHLQCPGGCNLGICISRSPVVCQCPPGVLGDRCDAQVPDATSAVVCEQSEYLVGEAAKCRFLSRRSSVASPSQAASFRLDVRVSTPPFGSVSLLDSEIGTGMRAGTEFPFRFTPERPWDEPEEVFVARASTEQGMQAIYSPRLRAFAAPDATSEVVCPKQRVLIGEPVSCRIIAKRGGVPIVTLARAFSAFAGPSGHVTKIAVAKERKGKAAAAAAAAAAAKGKDGTKPADKTASTGSSTTSSAGGGAGKQKKKGRRTQSADAGAEFSFRYTALRLDADSSSSKDADGGVPASRADLRVLVRGAGPNAVNNVELSFAPLLHVSPGADDFFANAKRSFFKRDFRTSIDLLTATLQSQPQHKAEALLLRAQMLIIVGKFKQAAADYNEIAQMSKANPELAKNVGLKEKRRKLDAALEQQQKGVMAHALGDYMASIGHLSTALDTAMESVFLHLLRADCGLKTDNYQLVRYDTAMVLAVEPDNAKALLTLATATYRILGNGEAALSNLKYCMRVSHNQTDCAKEYDRVAQIVDARNAAVKLDESQSPGAADALMGVIQLEPRGPFARPMYARLCALQRRAHVSAASAMTNADATKMVAACTHALQGLDSSVKANHAALIDIYLNRAWAFLQMKKYDFGLQDVARCNEMNNADPRIEAMRQDLLRAKQGLDKKNYYEVLQVPRDATAAEIKRAYRKLALQWHPDKNDDPGAEEMFVMINEAFSVLGDEELRRRYDAGEQMNNPNQQQQQQQQAWFTNAEGETEFTEINIDAQKKAAKEAREAEKRAKEEEERRRNAPMPKHCCLPDALDW